MEQTGQRSKGHTERRILVRSYATGLWPRLATLVRGSSRRITTMTASASSIREYQSDQPSRSRFDRCPVCSKPPTASMPECSPASRVRALTRAGYAALDPGCALRPGPARMGPGTGQNFSLAGSFHIRSSSE